MRRMVESGVRMREEVLRRRRMLLMLGRMLQLLVVAKVVRRVELLRLRGRREDLLLLWLRLLRPLMLLLLLPLLPPTHLRLLLPEERRRPRLALRVLRLLLHQASQPVATLLRVPQEAQVGGHDVVQALEKSLVPSVSHC